MGIEALPEFPTRHSGRITAGGPEPGARLSSVLRSSAFCDTLDFACVR